MRLFRVPHQRSKAFRDGILKVAAKCSAAFILNHKEAFKSFAALQDNAADALKETAFACMDVAMDAVYAHCS